MEARLKVEMQLPILIKQENSLFVACCPLLDVVSQGRTHDEAMANVVEALELFVQTCYEMGTLDEVLRESGFSFMPYSDADTDSLEADDDVEYTTIPMSLGARRGETIPC